MTVAFFPFAIAAAIVLLLLPVLAAAAPRLGLLDQPDRIRKLHEAPVPLVGGLTVFLAATTAVFLAILFGGTALSAGDFIEMLGLLAASTILVVVGVVDDRSHLRGRQKLLGQVAAVTLLVVTGYQFTQFVVIVPIRFGSFSVLVVYAWCLAAINAMNLLDGADGFAATVGIIASLAMGFLCTYQHRYLDATVCLALAGGLVGFLRFNLPPAKAYLGDAGSMLIGLVLAAVSIRSSFKQAALYSVAAPGALLAIPFIDTAAAIVRRRLTGRSIYHDDRGHMHHLMARLGPVSSLCWVALLSGITAVGGVLAVVHQQSAYAILSIFLVLLLMVGSGIFGRAEAALLARSFVALARSLFRAPGSKEQRVVETAVAIQGHGPWEELWSRLAEFAVARGLNQVTLDVNAPWLHESYHGDWKKEGVRTSPSQQWQAELPLMVSGRILGRVTIRADRSSEIPYRDLVANLLELTGEVEKSVVDPESDRSPVVSGAYVA